MEKSYNVVNGHFFVYEPMSDKPTATHMSTEYDNDNWYNSILGLVYEPA